MKTTMIFSIAIVILFVFIFFWALQCHKQAEYEYYSNNQMGLISKLLSGLDLRTPTEEEQKAMAKCLNAAFNTNEHKADDMNLMNVALKFITG
jgi:hypothetical protein